MYAALAQVLHGSNLAGGIARLSAELKRRPSSVAAFHMSLGDGYRLNGEPGKAVEAYRQAVKLMPNSARPVRFLGIAYKASGQPARAAEAFERAAQIAPNDPQSWFELALLASE